MKTKKFKKKLVLNKVTIVHLNNYELKRINGGGDEPPDLYTDIDDFCDTGSLTKEGPGCLLVPDLHD